MRFLSAYIILVNSMVTVSAEVQSSGDVMRASLTFSPDRSQFFYSESVFMGCEDRQSNSTDWRVKRTDIYNFTSECYGRRLKYWRPLRMNTTAGCLVRTRFSGVYWCESSEGKSNTVNITVTAYGRLVILGMTVLPVMEGSDVTLHCLYENRTTRQQSSDLPAHFYKDGSLIRTESTGQMTIHSVYKSDEGFYKCNISDLGESSESWMDVRDSPASKDNDQPDSSSLPPYFYPLMGAGVSIVLLILGLSLWKKCRDPCSVRPVQFQGTNQGPAVNQRTNQSGAPDDVYCQLQHGNTSVYGVLKRSDDYGNVTVSPTPKSEVDPVYSNQE